MNIEEIKQKGTPPILTEDLATKEAVIINAMNKDFKFLWASDGELVCVLYKGKPMAMIVKETERGYSASINKEGFFGLPWNKKIYDNYFKQ